MDLHGTLSTLLKAGLAEQKLTPRQLADTTGVSYQNVLHYLRGTRGVDCLGTWQELLDGVDPEVIEAKAAEEARALAEDARIAAEEEARVAKWMNGSGMME